MPDFKPKTCADCGQQFTPTNGNQKWCDTHRPGHQKKKTASVPVLNVMTAPAAPLQPAPVPVGDEVIEGKVMSAVPKSRKQWAKILGHIQRRLVGSIIEFGQGLAAAKADLPHGEWTPFCIDDLHISARTAEVYIRIGANQVLADPQHVAALPPFWGTLGELDRMPGASLQKAIEAGHVAPDMERAGAVRVRKAYQDGDVASLDMPKPLSSGSKQHAGAWPLVQALTALEPGEEAARYPQKSWVLDLQLLLEWAARALRALGAEPALPPEDSPVPGEDWAHGGHATVVSFPPV